MTRIASTAVIYRPPELLDLLVLQRRIQAESAQAVRQLKARLETSGEDSH